MRGQVDYLVVCGNRTNNSFIEPVDPAHERAMYIPTIVEWLTIYPGVAGFITVTYLLAQ